MVLIYIFVLFPIDAEHSTRSTSLIQSEFFKKSKLGVGAWGDVNLGN